MGNEAIGRGIVECGVRRCHLLPRDPGLGDPGSRRGFSREAAHRMHVEWSVNEKVAYEVALAASYTGKRAAVSMKQVGLNVASDPFMRSAYLGVKGGLLLVSADDPGPHSSQTEQDSRFFAMFAKIPVLDPSSPREAKEMVRLAFDAVGGLRDPGDAPADDAHLSRPPGRPAPRPRSVRPARPGSRRIRNAGRATPGVSHRPASRATEKLAGWPPIAGSPAVHSRRRDIPRGVHGRLGGGLRPRPGRPRRAGRLPGRSTSTR